MINRKKNKMENPDITYIYALCDPDTGMVRYVGKVQIQKYDLGSTYVWMTIHTNQTGSTN